MQQPDANVHMIKIVVQETEACNKLSEPRTSAPPSIGIEALLRTGAHGITSVSVGPLPIQNLKVIRALEGMYNFRVP